MMKFLKSLFLIGTVPLSHFDLTNNGIQFPEHNNLIRLINSMD